MKLAEQRWVHAVWCDDVRQEVGNKPSLMGVYFNDFVPPVLPTVVPKLCVYVQLGTPLTRPFKNLVIRVTRNDAEEPLAIIELPSEQLTHAVAMTPMLTPEQLDEKEPEPRGLGMNFILQMGPLEFTEKTKWLKVWVDTEDDTLESFKLRINSAAGFSARLQQAMPLPRPH